MAVTQERRIQRESGPARAQSRQPRHEFAGTGALLRLALRRDRAMLPLWVAIFVLTVVSSAEATADLYPDVAGRAQAAEAINSVPSFVALYGRIWDPSSLGALSILKMNGIMAALIAVLAVVLVVRHTRAEEESGRLESIAAARVGRRAVLTSALLTVLIAMGAIGLLTAVGQIAVGLPIAGSWVFGLSLALVGMSFALVAAVSAQVFQSSRSAISFALVVLGVAYVLRGIGDVWGDSSGPAWPSWLSPVGWGQQARPYAGDRWWVLVLPVVWCLALLVLAYALSSHRDLGAGLLPERRGRAQAHRSLSGPLGLALRLDGFAMTGWLIAFVLLGGLLGNVGSSLGDLLNSEQAREFIQRLGGTTVFTDAYISAEFRIMAFVTASFGIAMVLRLRIDEVEGRTDQVLAGAVSRPRALSGQLLVALGGTALLSVVLGVFTALASGLATDDFSRFWPIIGGALVELPAVWVMVGAAALLYALSPQWSLGAWVLLVGALLVEEVGALLELPQWMRDVSPFAHAPRLPGADMQWLPVLVLLGIAAVLLVAAVARFRARDVRVA